MKRTNVTPPERSYAVACPASAAALARSFFFGLGAGLVRSSFSSFTVRNFITESVSLGYEEIKLEYTEQKPDGTKGAVVQHGWNLAKNKTAG